MEGRSRRDHGARDAVTAVTAVTSRAGLPVNIARTGALSPHATPPRPPREQVHFRVASPPVTNPCFYGMDFPSRGELFANQVIIIIIIINNILSILLLAAAAAAAAAWRRAVCCV